MSLASFNSVGSEKEKDMSKGSNIVNVRIEDGLYERMAEEVHTHNERSADAQWSLSDWIRKAIMEKIAHADRGRQKTRERRYQCVQCNNRFNINKIAYVVKPLYGKREYTCEFCTRVGLCVGADGKPRSGKPNLPPRPLDHEQ